MAVTSGSCSASHSYITETLSWWQTGQSIEGNYTDIGWSLVLSRTYSISSSQSKAYSVNIDGQVWSGSTSISGSGSKTVASGTKRIYHNSDGSRSFSFSFSQTFGINYNGYLSSLSSSGSSELYSIARYSVISSADNFTDEGNPTMKFTNPSGVFPIKCKIEAGGNTQLITRTLANNATSCTFNLTDSERATLRKLASTSNSLTTRFTVCSMSGSNELSASYLDKTMTIVNGNPTFSNFTYKDTNTTVPAVTGNDQVLVKGISNLQATISSANKMVAQKEATAKNYVATIDTTNISKDYSTSDIVFDLGTVSSSGTKRLNIRAYDSRNNSTLVYKDITAYDYNKPVLNVSATRLNNFEDTTTLSVNGSFSSLLIGGAEKNALGKVEYRWKERGSNLFDYASNVIASKEGLSSSVSNGLLTCVGTPTNTFIHITNDIDITSDLEDGQEYTISQSVASDKLSIEIRMTRKSDGLYNYCNCRSATSSTNTFVVDKSTYSKYEVYVITSGDMTTPINMSATYWLLKSTNDWSDWTELTTTLTDNTFKCTDIVLKLDNTNAFDFEVRVTDNLSTTTKSASVDIGKSIFFISSNKKACYINGQEILQYEIVDEW